MSTRYNNSSPARKFSSTASQAGPRTGHPPRTDEREFVLPLLRAAGRTGINRNHFLKGTGPLTGRQVTQVGRLIHQLEREGYIFKHERRNDSPFIYYVLVGEPNEPRKPVQSAPRPGWRSQGFSFGNQAASTPQQAQTFLNFETGRTR